MKLKSLLIPHDETHLWQKKLSYIYTRQSMLDLLQAMTFQDKSVSIVEDRSIWISLLAIQTAIQHFYPARATK